MNSDDEDEWAALGFEAPGAVHQEVVQCTRHRALLPIPASSDESEDDASAATASTAAAVAAAAASKVCDANSESDDDEDDDAGDNGREEGMEEVCFLQVPNDVAEKLNRMLRLQGASSSSSSSSSTSPTSVQVMFDETPGDGPQHARLRVGDLELPGRLCNLPTIVEVHKSFDPKCGTYHKANQAGQMIVVDHDEAVLPTERELPKRPQCPHRTDSQAQVAAQAAGRAHCRRRGPPGGGVVVPRQAPTGSGQEGARLGGRLRGRARRRRGGARVCEFVLSNHIHGANHTAGG